MLQVNFCLPSSYPVTPVSFNYSPVAVGVVVIGASAAWWIPKYGARYWYIGPKATKERAAHPEELHQLVASPA